MRRSTRTTHRELRRSSPAWFPTDRRSSRATVALPRPHQHPRRDMLTFQQLILRLQDYWDRRAVRCCSPTTWRSAPAPATRRRSCAPSVPSPGRRPTCSRAGAPRTVATATIPNRLQHYYQYQVVLKPAPADILDLYLGSLEGSRLRPQQERRSLRRGRLGKPDARLLGPRLGSLAQRHGSDAVHLLPAGRRHRLPTDHGRDHLRPRAPVHVPAGRRERVRPRIRRGHQVPRRVPPERGRAEHLQLRALARRVLAAGTSTQHEAGNRPPDGSSSSRCPRTSSCSRLGHTFNLLDARGAISVTERAAYIGRIRNLARTVAKSYLDSRARLGFPMADKQWADEVLRSSPPTRRSVRPRPRKRRARSRRPRQPAFLHRPRRRVRQHRRQARRRPKLAEAAR